MRGRGWIVGVGTAVLVVAACGNGDDQATVATRPGGPTRASVVGTEPTTTVPASTVAPTTTAAPTTTLATTTTSTPATTAPPTTSAPAGWQPVEFVPGATPVGYSGNWTGEPSPVVAAGQSPLPDGYYFGRLLAPWDAATPGVLRAELRRFGFCRDLPAGTCEENPDDLNELGLDPAWSQEVEVPLDATTNVVVAGLTCEPDVKQGTGADLAELFTAFDASYQAVIAPSALAGVEDLEIAQSLGGETVQGFVADETLCPGFFSGTLHFQHGTSPSLLLQVLLRYNADGPPSVLTPTDVAPLWGVRVAAGVPTYYFYAGLIS